MTFSISFSKTKEANYCKGFITLGQFTETFYSCLTHFDRGQYKRQWMKAVSGVVSQREITALFKSIDIDADGVGTLWLYSLIPSEFAGDRETKRLGLMFFPEQKDGGVYETERCLNVTVRSSNFERRIYEEFEGGIKNELALYYLDLAAPERFFWVP
jgi:hypothetical protein